MFRHEFVLVLSYHQDTTALRVVEQLRHRGTPVLFLDTGSFPSHLSLEATFDETIWQGIWSYEGERYPLSHIKSILVRRPSHYHVNEDAPDLVQAFMENEAWKGFGGILRSLDCFWMNELDAHRRANFKPLQLQIASQLGFTTPRSLITNDAGAVRRFFEACDGNIVYKTIHGGYIAGGGMTYHSLFTSSVTSEHLQQLKNVTQTAHCFQEYVEKAFELRITVIGEQVLTVALHSQEATATKMDWRVATKDLRYSTYQLPQAIQQRCIQLLQHLHLAYGAIDMIVTPSDKYVFLEINPGGQYEWLEVATGLPFSATIAEVLGNGKDREDG